MPQGAAADRGQEVRRGAEEARDSRWAHRKVWHRLHGQGNACKKEVIDQ